MQKFLIIFGHEIANSDRSVVDLEEILDQQAPIHITQTFFTFGWPAVGWRSIPLKVKLSYLPTYFAEEL